MLGLRGTSETRRWHTSLNTTRRRFLGTIGLGSAALWLWPKGAAADERPELRTLEVDRQSVEPVNGQYVLPPLPYPFEALEPYIDAETMYLHHDKHHQDYVNNLNNALANYPDLRTRSVTDLVYNLDSLPAAVQTAVRNQGGGHLNHSIFWATMGPGKGGAPSGDLAAAIDATFGGLDNLKGQMNETARTRFGSGWAWLVLDGAGAMQIVSMPNQDSPYMFGLIPLLGVDVWEHAYYLRYRQKRVEYLTAWWNTVNWDAVAMRYAGSR